MDTSHINKVKTPQHDGTPRSRMAVLATDLGRHMTYVERLNEMAMLEGAR